MSLNPGSKVQICQILALKTHINGAGRSQPIQLHILTLPPGPELSSLFHTSAVGFHDHDRCKTSRGLCKDWSTKVRLGLLEKASITSPANQKTNLNLTQGQIGRISHFKSVKTHLGHLLTLIIYLFFC